ncbi:L-lactate permease [Staphylococcus aureus]|nr:L-lactate permease [Staphylococcus aureus]
MQVDYSALHLKSLWLPVLTICFILAISKITTYGGLSAAMGQGIAKAGNVFPVLSPILGWIGCVYDRISCK